MNNRCSEQVIDYVLKGRWLDYIMLALAALAWVATPVILGRSVGLDSSVIQAALAVSGLILGGALFAAGKFNHRLSCNISSLSNWNPPSIWISVVIGLLFRIALVYLFPAVPASDGATYLRLAQQILTEGRFEVGGMQAYWPPGYSFSLIPWLAVFPSNLAIVLSQCALFVIGISGIYRLGLFLSNSKAAQLTALLYALWPNVLALTGVPVKEMVIVALLPWGCLWFLQSGQVIKLFSGITIGFCVLVQPSLQFLSIFFIVLTPIIHGWRKTVMTVLLFIVGAGLVVLPWTIRNYNTFHQFVLVSTNGGYNLYRANNPLADGGYTEFGAVDLSSLSEIEQDKVGKKLAIEWITHNPIDFLHLVVEKQLRFMGDDSYGVYELKRGQAIDSSSVYAIAKFGANAWWLLMWLLIAYLSIKLPHKNISFRIIAWFWLYLFVLHSVFESNGKYHVPMFWVLCLWIGCAVFASNNENQARK